jgi:hypothetical protein
MKESAEQTDFTQCWDSFSDVIHAQIFELLFRV